MIKETRNECGKEWPTEVLSFTVLNLLQQELRTEHFNFGSQRVKELGQFFFPQIFMVEDLYLSNLGQVCFL